jgi:hypothetical protein
VVKTGDAHASTNESPGRRFRTEARAPRSSPSQHRAPYDLRVADGR